MIGSVAFEVVFTVGIFLLFVLILFGCSRGRVPESQPSRRNRTIGINTDRDPETAEHGLDEATLNSYPKLLYSEAKKGVSTPSCCPICLVDYTDTDALRFLPDCAHLFHVDCIDPWMMMHPTCPICRHTPLPAGPVTTLILPGGRLGNELPTR
ncbi:RING-H2 finger protein ATL70 [Morella rubra]|uniref:RING-H2 finger protein ATL70 n=1 Tax=Morella rubra TaxID=262757 RepID=A0A6A1WLQ1_9ROSI|nr:RING-H2 finger protein ATL70 [Morella rubra]